MGIMDAVKKGFALTAKALPLILILFGFNLVWNLASIPFAQPAATPNPQVTASALGLSLLFILISIFVQGSSLGLVRDTIKEGAMKLSQFVAYGAKYYLRLLLLGILIVLIIAIIALVAAVVVAVTAPLNNVVVTIVAAVIAIAIAAAGLYAILLLMLSPYALVCEELGVVASMKRSMEVVKKSIGKVILLLVVLILIALGAGFVIGFLTGLITAAMPVQASQIVIGVINSAFNGYFGIVMLGSFMAFYLAIAGKEKVAAQKVF